MMTRSGKTGAQHPIQVVSRRTGLSQDVIRVWERRYRAVSPDRSETNRRLYSDEDVQRLLLLRRATLGGRRIGDVAALSTAELLALVTEDEAASLGSGQSPRRPPSSSSSAAKRLERCIDAIEGFDPGRLENALSDAVVDLTTPLLIDELLEPLLRTIGERWREGTLRVAQEHMATAILYSFLHTIRTGCQSHAAPGPDLIVTTPARQVHELGALMVAVTATLEGWRVTYLGADLPAEEIAATARHRGSKAVALSIVYPADDPRLADELRKLRRLLPEVPLLSGGAAAGAYSGVLEEIGAIRVGDMSGLRSQLQATRYAP